MIASTVLPATACALCHRPEPLRESHIIPAFVWRWLKETTPSAIRSSENPNLRVQDGWKEPLLCDDCEGRFSVWERDLEQTVFTPIVSASATGPIIYGPRVLKAAVSISWRVLVSHQRLGIVPRTAEQERCIQTAADTWRAFLLDEEPHPGEFEQHLVIGNFVESTNRVALSPHFNRYLVRAIAMDFLTTETSALCYAKMGRCILFGHVQSPERGRWRRSRIAAKGGRLELDGCLGLPVGILHYWNDQADVVGGMRSKMSPRQREKVDAARDSDPQKFTNSEIFRAFMCDLEHSGDAAFTHVEPTSA